ncbi:MAG: 4Fe-4S binding protein, partial [Firmicutes bacterium]|nr:4Fe-4S binding protein [Bacillota bacterium]
DPAESPPIRIASEKGYGTLHLERIDIHGPSIEELKVEDFRVPRAARPSMRQRAMSGRTGLVLRNWFTTRPTVLHDLCRGCKICAKACPAEAIEVRSGIAQMDYSKCIRCYCCQELCEYGAITLKTPPLARIFQ